MAKGTRLRLVFWTLVLLGGGATASYLLWWPRGPAVPAIKTDGLDAEVVAAIAKARADVEARPRSAAAWGHLGMVLFAQDMYADCLAIFAEAERLDAKDARWPYFRGLALIHQKPDEGIGALERAAAIAPPSLTARLRLAEEYFKLDRIDEADALFRELLGEYPDNPRALLGRGRILSRRGQWQEALAPLKIAAESSTARRSARDALVEAYARLGNAAAAEAERQRAAQTPADLGWPDSFLAEAQPLRTGLQPRIDRALAMFQNGQLDDARDLLEQVLRDHADSDEAHLTLAKVLIKGGAFEEADRELRQALKLNPKLADAHFLLGGTQMLQKDYDAAEGSYLRAIELKPSHALAHYQLGDCRLKQDNKAKAVEAFRDAVRYRPDLAVGHLELGALLLQDGSVDEAINHLDQAVRLDSTSERARSLLEQARAKKKG